MTVFVYTAIDPVRNQNIEGKVEAANLREAKALLRNQGHIPTQIAQDEQGMTVEELLPRLPLIGHLLTPHIGLKDINIMTQQLYTLLNAGVPLIEGLFMLEQQSENKAL